MRTLPRVAIHQVGRGKTAIAQIRSLRSQHRLKVIIADVRFNEDRVFVRTSPIEGSRTALREIEQLKNRVRNLESRSLLILRKVLTGGVIDQVDGYTRTTFLFSTGVGTRRFGVGQFMSIVPPFVEIARPEVEKLADAPDSLKITFWREVLDNQIEVWLYQESSQSF